ncbi:unannotated protein [freshwater metagenome]|uniref:Unannotated protein n=1 Tax=freshwater metagenome TaxID=449393 RepID=A0A6J6VYG2_9ZZZZ
MPGYCTFTATTRPSRVTALCTWPIDAAAIGVSPQSRKTLRGSPSSSVTTCVASAGAIGGASAWSVASACCASSGSDSMMKPIS